ncbi:Eukaryotic translation initiation factor 3 subunit F [Porphyridium purpureum]|uniref:Eukaryotic translation initiation factor 3 subunit F n=1 Tax=Porphyridium purpureum TaxID=35688 RepID=A0A5J4YZS3_PORPP|nr:Eukaryotic translation initiation factor 3 subunit F [Porphyridium purpureum]|eukprot:POR3864..scf208_2
MDDTTDIFLGGEGYDVKCVRVSPVVLFSVLDHFIRRPETNHRVIGALIGTLHDDFSVDVRSAFPVPHSEPNGEAALDDEYFATMLDLHSKVSPNEQIVGWYGTGRVTDANSVVFHEFFGRSCACPVHLLVDADLEGDNFHPVAFVTTACSINEMPLSSEFRQVPVLLEVSSSEKVGLDALSTDLKRREALGEDADDDDDDEEDDEEEEANAVLAAESVPSFFQTDHQTTAESRKLRRLRKKYAMPTEVENLERSLVRLRELVEIVGESVDRVVSGQDKGDIKVGRCLAETLASVPLVNPIEFEKMISDSLRDHLMVMYCAKLTQVQLAMAEKLLEVDLR